jgi:hypothetical protein
MRYGTQTLIDTLDKQSQKGTGNVIVVRLPDFPSHIQYSLPWSTTYNYETVLIH